MNEVFNKKHDWSNSDCCCDIETLRKILRLFQGRNIDFTVITRNGAFIGFVFDLDEDILYISSTFGDSPNQFVPLCSIVSFLGDTDSDLLADEFREKILDIINPTCNLNPCCCTDGVADTINGIKQTFPPTTLLDIRLDTDIFFVSIIITPGVMVKATDDIVFVVIEDFILIIPTCGIDSIITVITTNGFSKQNQSFKDIFKKIK